MKLFNKSFSLGTKKYATLKVGDSDKQVSKSPDGMLENKLTGLWTKCPNCQEMHYKVDVVSNYSKCPSCNHYFKMSARERINLLIDQGTFEETHENYTSENRLGFPGYTEKYREAVNKCDMNDGVVSGVGLLYGRKVSIAAMDFSFFGGSMGSVVGEKITAAMELGAEEHIPVIIVATSGGARMHEGLVSLMQMAKTSAAAEKLKRAGVPFISVPVDPTTGGVTASFAMLGDIIISEPNALIGFAGARVIEQTIHQKLPEGFQRSEFLQACGMVDIIAKREDLKMTISTVLSNIL